MDACQLTHAFGCSPIFGIFIDRLVVILITLYIEGVMHHLNYSKFATPIDTTTSNMDTINIKLDETLHWK